MAHKGVREQRMWKERINKEIKCFRRVFSIMDELSQRNNRKVTMASEIKQKIQSDKRE